MARIRSIHPGLFTDEAFAGLSCDAQIFLIGLWTEADDQGVFEWKPLTLRMRLRPTRDGAVDPLLDGLAAFDIIRKFAIGGKSYGAIRNFRKYQRPKSPNSVHPINDDIRNYVALTGAISEIDVPKPDSIPQKEESTPQMEEEGGKLEKKESSPKRVRTDYPDDFENLFWKPYPTTQIMSKKEAFREWQRLDIEQQKLACDAIPGFKSFLAKNPTHSVVHACRFLSQERSEGFKPKVADESAEALMRSKGYEWRDERWQKVEPTEGRAA